MKAIITTFKAIKENESLLSSSLYRNIHFANENHLPLKSLLKRELTRDNLGKEVGSINYVTGSNFYFTKTKALQAYSFLPILNTESTESITPQAFVDYHLKKGDIILSKDGNIGETVILDKDYPHHMLSGALYKLPLNEADKYYILAVIKHSYFREQLSHLVPKGATLRHAGTKFLDCKIPFPTKNKDVIVNYVSYVTQKIVEIEIEIRKRSNEINNLIETAIIQNQRPDSDYVFSHATFHQLSVDKRLDTGVYSETFQRINHLLTHYKRGTFCIDPTKLKSGSTPKIRTIASYREGSTRWITPTNCSDWGFIQTHEQISAPIKNNLSQDATLLINRTSRGGKGEYVGIGTFYDYEAYGEGHHNQGIYRVTGYDKKMLIFITAFMNTRMMRKYCSALSVGSKMKEIKSDQFLSIPIPAIEQKVLDQVYKLFYTDHLDKDIDHLLSVQPHTIGLFHLNAVEGLLTKHLNTVLNMIIDDVAFNIVDNRIQK